MKAVNIARWRDPHKDPPKLGKFVLGHRKDSGGFFIGRRVSKCDPEWMTQENDVLLAVEVEAWVDLPYPDESPRALDVEKLRMVAGTAARWVEENRESIGTYAAIELEDAARTLTEVLRQGDEA